MTVNPENITFFGKPEIIHALEDLAADRRSFFHEPPDEFDEQFRQDEKALLAAAAILESIDFETTGITINGPGDYTVRIAERSDQTGDAKKPPFSASRAEEYFFMLRDYFRDEKERIFKRDNEGRHPFDQLYSAEYQKALGKELALREVLDYFSKYDFPEDGDAGEEGAE